MKIQVSLGREKVFINSSEIVFLKADNIYCYIHLNNGEVLRSSNTIGYFARVLTFFFKPHRSYLINLWHLKRFNKVDGELEMDHYNTIIPLSRGFKKDFLDVLSRF